jgi:putative hydrolase of HD superfamily
MLCTELEVDDIIKLKAIELALVHDIPEIITNDITHDAKQRMPEIVEILAKYENQFMNLHFPELSVQADEVSHIANLIVRLADTISVLQFTNNEINLGNTELLEWIPNTKHRISELRKQLQEVGIKCQKIMI